jgi:hypothetical protein
LDLDPKRSGAELRRTTLGQSYRERAAVLRPRWKIGPAVDLHARKATVVIIKEDIETVGRSLPTDVRAINIDPFHQPRLTHGHDKIVCKIRIKVGKVSEGCGQRHGGSGVIVLLPQRYRREFRRWRNRALRLSGSTRRREPHGEWHLRCIDGGVNSASLSERDWDHENSQQQKQVKRASKKMRFDERPNSPFHKSTLSDFRW